MADAALESAEMRKDNHHILGLTDDYEALTAAESRDDWGSDRYGRARDGDRDQGYGSDRITEAESWEN